MKHKLCALICIDFSLYSSHLITFSTSSITALLRLVISRGSSSSGLFCVGVSSGLVIMQGQLIITRLVLCQGLLRLVIKVCKI